MDRILIGLLVLIVVVVLFKYSPSYFPSTSGTAPAAATSVQDVKTMLSSGMPEINIIVNLIKSGVPSAQAEQLVMQAKHS